MKIKTLEYFITLAESASINEAAQKLFVAQPSLTKALHHLEEELGFVLFERGRHGITLTSMGQQILPEARQIVDIYQSWLDLPKKNVLTDIEIHVHTSFFNFLFPNIILGMKEKYPKLNIIYASHNKPDQFISRSIQAPVLALFCCDGGKKMEHFTQVQGNPPAVLFTGSYRCLVSKDSPLAKQAAVTLEELQDYILVLPKIKDVIQDPAYSQLLDVVANMPLEKIAEVGSLENVTSLVSHQPNTFAVSYYPALMRYRDVESGKLVHVPIRDSNKLGRLCLFYSTRAYQQHPAVKEIVLAVRQGAREFLSEHHIAPPDPAEDE